MPLPAAFRCVLLALLAAGCSQRTTEPSTGERIQRLRERVERQRSISARAAATYAPRVAGRIDDPRAAAILRRLPGIAKVEVLVAARKPAHRIIHL
jgi:hypothetical protein